MQAYEETQVAGLSKFTSLVYLYTGLGIVFWLAAAFALAKNQAISMPILSWMTNHPIMSSIVIIVVAMILLSLCRSFVQSSYLLTFVCYLAFLGVFSILGVPIFFTYSAKSITQALILTSVIFFVMAGYGYLTKTDLSRWSRTLIIGLVAILAVSLIDVFLLKSPLIALIVNIVTIIIFMGYIAYDSQNLKRIYTASQGQNLGALALVASVDLILDFINLLMNLLAIFGNNDN
ncbi:Bax inhibitor-1/YccA family protein [Bombilactobacillus folatiphilus]|uniref:Bax inhibitor-1/YccA family protein n=1 Tax=Bombilactobacillus folatiphilus TaxID=2923362 RepID=A0ABY4P985_9LACO|nr:Bax inhibitor-1/YccA family protein [Bombilactobacillus folatiphilus]UQS82154.1 Bax inhibitor-1/YccA family protein [Bombilactobacillus folatiphilus]